MKSPAGNDDVRIPSSVAEARNVIASATFGGVTPSDLRCAQAFYAGWNGEEIRSPHTAQEWEVYTRAVLFRREER